MPNELIIIIDDNLDMIHSISLALEDDGYKVIGMQDDRELYKPEFSNPNLILLDMYLQAASGTSLLKNLRSSPKTQNIPIILMSGHPDLNKIAADNNIRFYLEKPFNTEQLVDMIQKSLKH